MRSVYNKVVSSWIINSAIVAVALTIYYQEATDWVRAFALLFTIVFLALFMINYATSLSILVNEIFGDYRKQRAPLWSSVWRHTISCYFRTVVMFSIAYKFVSEATPDGFNLGSIDILTSTYFSIVTITTIGFGDIVPTHWITRSLLLKLY